MYFDNADKTINLKDSWHVWKKNQDHYKFLYIMKVLSGKMNKYIFFFYRKLQKNLFKFLIE